MHVLLIGLGNMGMKYLAKLEELQELPVLCDVDPYKNIERYPFYCHFGEVKEEIKRVIVAVNPEQHVAIAREFLSRDIPVLLEKPPARKSSEFREIAENKNLEISEIELYSYPVKNFPRGVEVREILVERLNKGRGYINPLWDLAWHDMYILQYLFGELKLEDFKEGKVWELTGTAGGIPFRIRVAWEYEGNVVRRWVLKTSKGDILMDLLKEEIAYDGKVLRKNQGDKLREMVEDFLKGMRREGSAERALKNLELLESLT
ncbi:putative dehydrogenase [Hydrogenivirga caldilitoris]|uniref:Putative dehydrogenase n=1 Tax=Hydrogenivirga caldilitoris TaxID=246264 RepID=A0A497XRJ9_9AQUI|nr:Gfo/Idh/MocA family oxidoreductase [Hydrogenivirga caldilitoris]RLJ70904.1 putative dehydrogenase [Hydrogenivirga caldilitoris]